MTTNFTLNETAQQLEQQIRDNRLMSLPIPWENEIIYPHYGGLSIYNLAQSLLELLGGEAKKPLDPAVWGGSSPVGQVKRVVFFLTDGLSYKLLREMAEEDPTIAENIQTITDGRGYVPLTSTVPSTTVVALPTFWTAATPAEHGMLGTSMFLQDFATLGSLLSFAPVIGSHKRGVFGEWGMDMEFFVPVPPLADRLSDIGVMTHLLLDYRLMGTGLSAILHRGVIYHHQHMASLDMWLRLQDVLEQTTGQSVYIHAYWPLVDTLSHAYGASSAYVKNEIRHQMSELATLLSNEDLYDGQTLFIVSADHGHYDAPDLLALTRAEQAALSDSIRLPFGGDSRFSQFFLRAGRKQQVINTLSQDYTDKLAWIEPEAALHAGLFGEDNHHPELISRLGDLMITPRLGTRLSDRIRPGSEVSIHAGMSDWEMLVPFMWKQI